MELIPRLMRLVRMARGFDVALATLGDALRAAQFEACLDLEKPSATEVRLGLASRQLRLLSYLAGNPMFWKYPVAEYVLRPLVDTRILIAWLIQKDDAELYEKFKRFGAGRLKLRKLHLDDFVEGELLRPTGPGAWRRRSFRSNPRSEADVREASTRPTLPGAGCSRPSS